MKKDNVQYFYFPVRKYGPEKDSYTDGFLHLSMHEALQMDKRWKASCKLNSNKHEIDAYEIFVNKGIPA